MVLLMSWIDTISNIRLALQKISVSIEYPLLFVVPQIIFVSSTVGFSTPCEICLHRLLQFLLFRKWLLFNVSSLAVLKLFPSWWRLGIVTSAIFKSVVYSLFKIAIVSWKINSDPRQEISGIYIHNRSICRWDQICFMF